MRAPPVVHETFLFEGYAFDRAAASLALRYRFDGGPAFAETIVFEGAARTLSAADDEAIDRIFRLIFLLCGVSYYKAYVPPLLRCTAFPLDRETAAFVEKVYRKGLAEFAFRNELALADRLHFEVDGSSSAAPVHLDLPRRTCVPVGGGKDSIVTLECLKRAAVPLVLFALGTAEPIQRTIEISGLPAIRVRRALDRRLFELNKAGAFNGHVPITGILSAIVAACAVLHGFDAIAMSNEHSASAPNLTLDELEVNHQYSKSLEFETDFAAYLARHVSPDLRYFSFLRPLTEIAIAARFSRHDAYFDDFRSCNKAFKQIAAERATNWCCECPKCRFVFLALAPFVAKERLVAIFGRNLLDDPGQYQGFAELCGLSAFKPFECVGEIGESAAAMSHLAEMPEWRADAIVAKLWPALAAASGNIPLYASLFAPRAPHRVPDDFLAILDACR